MRSIRLIGLITVLLMTGISASAAELMDNPLYTSWAKCKAGTSVTSRTELTMSGQRFDMETTATLTEVTPEKVVIEMQISGPMAQKRSVAIPAKAEADNVYQPGKAPGGIKGTAKSLGHEKVKVGDTEYDCEVTEFSGNDDGMSVKGKTWNCLGVPNLLVKLQMSGSNKSGSETMETIATLKSVTTK